MRNDQGTSEMFRRVVGVVAGVVAVGLTFALLGALGLAIGWLTLREASRVDRALAALLLVAPSAIVASAVGGWLAARLGGWRGERTGAAAGALIAAAALLTLAWAGDRVARTSLDLESVRDVLDGQQVVERELAALPPEFATALAAGTPSDDVEESARRRIWQAIGYGGGVVALILGAGALGGAVGSRRYGAVPTGRGDAGRDRANAL